MSAETSTIQKQHFLVLDGLRGIAAMVIVLFHFMEWLITDFKENFVGHGFLAVDFFFCLSGFVIAYAYDDRIKHIGLKKFFIGRLIRLHPLVIIGSILGLIGLLVTPFSKGEDYSFLQLLTLFASSILLIPYPILPERAFNLFSLNAPAWTLFWEYIGNLAYALFLFKIKKNILLILTLSFAIYLVYLSHSYGNLSGGWSKDNWEVGGIRLGYSFCAGLLLYRNRFIIKNNLGFVGLTILLLAALFMPFYTLNWLFESIVVILYFPFLIALGAGASLSNPLEKICRFLGNLSYPLYMTHYCVIWAFGAYLQSPSFHQGTVSYVIALGSLLLIAFGYIVMRFIDKPIRKKMANMLWNTNVKD
ncbi:acyltransferase family protein [Sphingobacterium bambusae]|uniref:Acyltransferase family protein n=1 Tax=Sphingobacterium bambusae TaxID=662858 RepID=A0ABW6BKB7_9SPHI|nr:acyltransferase [Sphingobacterium bambusae]WPL48947.1 acyltransferase [Sphingobacterium bambusae]